MVKYLQKRYKSMPTPIEAVIAAGESLTKYSNMDYDFFILHIWYTHYPNRWYVFCLGRTKLRETDTGTHKSGVLSIELHIYV